MTTWWKNIKRRYPNQKAELKIVQYPFANFEKGLNPLAAGGAYVNLNDTSYMYYNPGAANRFSNLKDRLKQGDDVICVTVGGSASAGNNRESDI